MSDPDRGAYTPPTDDPLAFDARRPSPARPRAPVTLLASLGVLGVLVIGAFAFYQSGLRSSGEAELVGEPVDALKGPPVEEARPIDEAATLDVYVEDAPSSGVAPTFVDGPEEPQPRAQAPQVVIAAAPPPPITPPPSMRPAQATPSTTTASAVAAPVQTQASAGGASIVQIGAYSSTALADEEAGKVAARFPQYTAGRATRVERVDRDGTTFYRAMFTGFARADAQAFCNAMKAAGRDCIVR